jgi:hypothetical protein
MRASSKLFGWLLAMPLAWGAATAAYAGPTPTPAPPTAVADLVCSPLDPVNGVFVECEVRFDVGDTPLGAYDDLRVQWSAHLQHGRRGQRDAPLQCLSDHQSRLADGNRERGSRQAAGDRSRV